MATGDWNYLAGRLQGDGSIEILETELPLQVDSIDRSLSAPSAMGGTITNRVKRLMKDGQPIFQPWNTVIIAMASDQIRGMTIYQRPTFNGNAWDLEQIGFSGYPSGMPYVDSKSFVNADPLDIFREVWNHLQSQPNGNLGITVDDLTCPVRVGTQVEDVSFTTSAGESVAFEAGPRKLSWYTTDDLGQVIDDYAKETPFDWLETLAWEADQPHCHIRLGYPQIGSRKDHFRLVLGENLASVPSVAQADYANQVQVLGAGEGRDRIRGSAGVSDGRLRRVAVIDDKSKTTIAQANSLAADILGQRRGQLIVDSIRVFDHPNAPLEAIELGDEIPLYAETDWTVVDQYVRVVKKSESPDSSNEAVLTVERKSEA